MFWKALVQRIHLWSGLILGIQVLLWMASGVVMSFYPIAQVRGETSVFAQEPQPLDTETYASPGGIIAQSEGVTSVKLRRFLGRPVYETAGPDGGGLYDAASGDKLTPLKEDMARRVATQDFIGDGEVVHASLISFPPQEYRGPTPVWRIDFNDKLNTRIYVSPATGEVKARRNDIWRLYDFFWMLHIMDYKERDNFNTWWLQLFAASGFIFALSGVVIVVLRLAHGRYAHDVRLATGMHAHRYSHKPGADNAKPE
ncbi:MAG: PepSY domain-containing protein [Parvularculaceae bacterium]